MKKVYVDQIDLSYVDPAQLKEILNGTRHDFTADWGPGMRGADVQERYVIGSATGYPNGKGGISVTDRYDFEMHSWSNEARRNLATAVGSVANHLIGGSMPNTFGAAVFNMLVQPTPFNISGNSR